MSGKRVLVVDDERQMRRALRTNLAVRGYEVVEAASGEEALRLAADHTPDVVLLDMGLAGIDGLDVIGGLRGWTQVPIIVLTVRDRESDKVEALDAGADDYITKPFGMNELLARVRAQLRRGGASDERGLVSTADFDIDLGAGRVLHDGDVVHLTPKEWGVVECLARHPGRLITQPQLLHEVWGNEYERETNYLRVFMAQIRKKLEPDPSRPRYFVTEPGIGYRLEGVMAPVADASEAER